MSRPHARGPTSATGVQCPGQHRRGCRPYRSAGSWWIASAVFSVLRKSPDAEAGEQKRHAHGSRPSGGPENCLMGRRESGTCAIAHDPEASTHGEISQVSRGDIFAIAKNSTVFAARPRKGIPWPCNKGACTPSPWPRQAKTARFPTRFPANCFPYSSVGVSIHPCLSRPDTLSTRRPSPRYSGPSHRIFHRLPKLFPRQAAWRHLRKSRDACSGQKRGQARMPVSYGFLLRNGPAAPNTEETEARRHGGCREGASRPRQPPFSFLGPC